MNFSIENLIGSAFGWYFSRKALPYWVVLLCDCFIVLVSMVVGYAVFNSFTATVANIHSLVITLCMYMLCYLIGFRILHTYSGVIRYSSFIDLFRVAGAVTLGSVLVMLLRIFASADSFLLPIGAHSLLVGTLLATIFMWFMRILVKVSFDARFAEHNAKNIMIFGTKEGGISIAKSIRNQHPMPYNIVGFITNYPDMMGHRLMNLPILGENDSKLWRFIDDKKVDMVIISPLVQEFFVNDCQAMIDRFISKHIHIFMMPPEQEWDGKSDLSHQTLREVSVEDLLPREKINVDLEAIGNMLKGQRILITGAAGSIGSEMVKQVAKFSPEEMILIDQAETPMHDVRRMMASNFPDVKCHTIVSSISNATHMEMIFAEHRPQYVFHAAAYKHVPMMEDNPAMAIQNNVYGTRVIADLAVKYGTKKFVMVSTDKAVNPTNVMGCSKRICEIYCQALNRAIMNHEGPAQHDGQPAITQFVTTRFGNVLGSNGSVIPIFREQIQKGGPVTVTHPDIIRFFMLIPEACRLVLEAGTMGNGGEIFVFDMGKPVRIADLAQRMIDLMGAKDVKIVYSGLRDGEKLYEEVLNDAEETKPTHHPKIKVANVREYPYDEALRNERELYDLSFQYDDMAIVGKMKEIVPEYKSKQSKYEVLDK